MILNNDLSYETRVICCPSISVNQDTGRDVQSVTIKFWDNYDYPDYEFTLMWNEIPTFIKEIKKCI